MGKSNSAPQAPDTSAISNAQSASAANSNANAATQLQWAQNQGVTDQATTDQAVAGSLGQQDQLNANAGADRSLYDSTAPGALQTLQTDANNYSNPGFKDQQVGGAIADQAAAADAARNNSTQQLEGYGVNPASTRFGALDIGTRMTQAANEATAGTNMGQQVDATGRALQQQVYTDAAPLAAQATNESTAGTAAGNTAVNEGLSTTATGASAQGTGAQWTGLANNAMSGQDNTVNSSYANQIAQNKANQTNSSGIGSLIGTAASLGLGALTGGASLPFTSLAMGAMGGENGGTASSPTPGISASDYGIGSNAGSASDQYGLSAAVGGPIAQPNGNPDATPGGAIPAGASPTRGQAVDDVPARLTVGEFVMPKDVVAWKGQEHFQKLIDKSREQAAAATAKPAVGNAPPQRPTFSSTPQGAIPMQRAA